MQFKTAFPIWSKHGVKDYWEACYLTKMLVTENCCCSWGHMH